MTTAATIDRLARRQDWQTRLARFVELGDRRAFEYGKHDCCLAACGAVLTMTGTDLAAEFRNRYAGADGAEVMLRERGGVDGIVEAVAAQHAIAEIDAALASRGDVVIVEHYETGERVRALGFVGLDGATAYVPGPIGWRRMPIACAVRAWRI